MSNSRAERVESARERVVTYMETEYVLHLDEKAARTILALLGAVSGTEFGTPRNNLKGLWEELGEAVFGESGWSTEYWGYEESQLLEGALSFRPYTYEAEEVTNE